MSAVVRIDGQGSLPTFLEKAQAGMDRMVKSENNVKGALRGIGASLDASASSAENASRAASVLADKFVRGLGGAAVVGAVKIVTDQISSMGQTLQQAAISAQQAIDRVSKMGDASTMDQATEQAKALSGAAEAINAELSKMESNRLTNFIGGITGARGEMEKLAESLQRAADAQTALGFALANQRSRDTAGMSKNDRELFDISEKTRSDVSQAQKISNPALRNQAVSDAYEKGARERNAKLDEIAAQDKKKIDEELLKKEMDATRSADGKRKRDMDEFQSELDRKSEKTTRDSARWLEDALSKLELNAKLVELNAEKLDLKGQEAAAQKEKQDIQAAAEGQSLSASRQGQQFLKSAQRRRAEANRRDNFKFNQEMAANRAAEMTSQSAAMANELMALRQLAAREGSTATDRTGRTIGDRIREIERSGMVDPSFGAKRFSLSDVQKRMADEKAARDDKSMRDQFTTDMSGVEDKLKDIREQLSKTLDEIANYSHAGAN